MIAQGADGIAGIVVSENGPLEIDRSALDPDAPLADSHFSSDAWVGLRAFLNAIADRDGPIKISVTGPVTLGIALRAASVEGELAFRIAGNAVRERVKSLVEHVLQRVPQAQVVIFLDEPAMGSLTEDGFPISPSAGVDLVSSALGVIEATAITGLHCCTAIDYRLLLSVGPRILSVPVNERIARNAGLVGDFLDRDGWIAWGAVPTGGPVGATPDRLWRQLSTVWSELAREGCDPILLRTNAIVTPVCGLAWHGVTQAEQVMEFCTELADRMASQAAGARSSVGA